MMKFRSFFWCVLLFTGRNFMGKKAATVNMDHYKMIHISVARVQIIPGIHTRIRLFLHFPEVTCSCVLQVWFILESCKWHTHTHSQWGETAQRQTVCVKGMWTRFSAVKTVHSHTVTFTVSGYVVKLLSSWCAQLWMYIVHQPELFFTWYLLPPFGSLYWFSQVVKT